MLYFCLLKHCRLWLRIEIFLIVVKGSPSKPFYVYTRSFQNFYKIINKYRILLWIKFKTIRLYQKEATRGKIGEMKMPVIVTYVCISERRVLSGQSTMY